MYIHPRIYEKQQFENLKKTIINNSFLSIYEILQVVNCKYRSELKLTLKKLWKQ